MSSKATSNEQQSSLTPLPTPIEFYFDIPLYKFFQFSNNQGDYIDSIELIEGPIDAYCIYCDDRSLFSRVSYVNDRSRGIQSRNFDVVINCNRIRTHTYLFSFMVSRMTIGKIGQFPSVADISLPQLIKYKKILGSDMYREFNKAVGLVAHGVGIGSFVYLRRILETLIESAHQDAMKAPDWNEEVYFQGRTVEKIQLLKGYLPEFMIRNRHAYGILSKGIHELTEDECLKYFKPLKSAIELILNEHLLLQEHQRNIREAEQTLADIHKELSGGD